jgi:hypothetical protein
MAGASEVIEDDGVGGCEFSAEFPDDIPVDEDIAVQLTSTSVIWQPQEDRERKLVKINRPVLAPPAPALSQGFGGDAVAILFKYGIVVHLLGSFDLHGPYRRVVGDGLRRAAMDEVVEFVRYRRSAPAEPRG